MSVKGTYPFTPVNSERCNCMCVGMGGQSNMDRFATDATLQAQYRGFRGDVTIFDGSGFPVMTTSNNSYPGAPASTHAGEFARLYRLADATSRMVMGIKHAVGSTSMAVNWQVGQALYENHCTTMQNGLQAITDMGMPCDFYYFWCQGENDSTNSTDANAYEARYLTQINDFVSRFHPKIYVCILTSSAIGGLYADSPIVKAGQIAAIASAAANPANAGTLFGTYDPSAIDPGNLHRTSAGYQTEGIGGANVLLSLM